MEWISVQKRHPERHTTVLIYLKNRGIFVGVLMEVSKKPYPEWWAMYSEGALVVPDQEAVTHWQPLPDPPNS